MRSSGRWRLMVAEASLGEALLLIVCAYYFICKSPARAVLMYFIGCHAAAAAVCVCRWQFDRAAQSTRVSAICKRTRVANWWWLNYPLQVTLIITTEWGMTRAFLYADVCTITITEQFSQSSTIPSNWPHKYTPPVINGHNPRGVQQQWAGVGGTANGIS